LRIGLSLLECPTAARTPPSPVATYSTDPPERFTRTGDGRGRCTLAAWRAPRPADGPVGSGKTTLPLELGELLEERQRAYPLAARETTLEILLPAGL
jgi:hypothetical protein